MSKILVSEWLRALADKLVAGELTVCTMAAITVRYECGTSGTWTLSQDGSSPSEVMIECGAAMFNTAAAQCANHLLETGAADDFGSVH